MPAQCARGGRPHGDAVSARHLVKLRLELVAYGGVLVRVPSAQDRAKLARGPYGEDAPVTADLEAYVASDDAMAEALGPDVWAKALERARKRGYTTVTTDDTAAGALWRWHLEGNTHDQA